MTSDELFDLLRPIIMAATGVPEIIPADDNHDAPPGPYATIEPFSSIRQRGQSYVTRASGSGGLMTKTIVTNMIAECSIQFYRGDAHMLASRLRGAGKRPSVSMAMMRVGLGWGAVGPVNDLTALQGNRNEQRAQVTVDVNYTDTVTDNLGLIEFVNVTATDDIGSEVVDFNVDVREPTIPDHNLTFDDTPLTYGDYFLTFTP